MLTNFGVEGRYDFVHVTAMLTKAELLSELEAQAKADKITYAQVGEVLGLPSSRVSEIFNAIRPSEGTCRELKYDEGVKLVAAFGLEQNPEAPQVLPVSILRLVVRHLALQLQAQASEARIAELAEDLRAFSEYVASPKVRQSIAAAEGFFEALQRRRPAREEEARLGTDHESDQTPHR